MWVRVWAYTVMEDTLSSSLNRWLLYQYAPGLVVSGSESTGLLGSLLNCLYADLIHLHLHLPHHDGSQKGLEAGSSGAGDEGGGRREDGSAST